MGGDEKYENFWQIKAYINFFFIYSSTDTRKIDGQNFILNKGLMKIHKSIHYTENGKATYNLSMYFHFGNFDF